MITYEENCRLKRSTMAINTFNISRGRKFPLQVLLTANLSFRIFQLTEGFGVMKVDIRITSDAQHNLFITFVGNMEF